jgi:RNA polymerase sigma-70 factor (ECF subfamily)
VRNTFYSRLPQKKLQEMTTTFDEELHDQNSEEFNPEKLVLQNINNQLLMQALAELPVEYREIVILRELEYLSYKEISELIAIPIGTVMSRLARARKKLQQTLAD